jgi:hypothetical protein
VAAVLAGMSLATGGAAPWAAGGPAGARGAHHPGGGELPSFGNPAGHAPVPPAGAVFGTSHPDHVIGNGTPASCTSAAVIRAVASGGVTVFHCGRRPVTIRMTATAKVTNTSHWVVLDGGGKVTLSGQGRHQLLYLDTCDRRQGTVPGCHNRRWPHLQVQNITLADGNSTVRQARGTDFGGGGGGAIYDLGGQLTVVNSRFLRNRCYRSGPDLGGASIRALLQWDQHPVYVSHSTFSGGQCANGGALSSIGVSWVVLDSVLTGNSAIGWGANPASRGTAGGGSGGAIYTDGNRYSVTIQSTILSGNQAREGGGGVFFVSDNGTGRLTFVNAQLHGNPSGVFWTRDYPGVYYHGAGRPRVRSSSFG